MSALVIFSLNQAPDTNSAAAEEFQLPTDGITATNNLVIEVSNNVYRFGADEGSVADLESLIARCQELISSSSDRQVVILASSDVSYRRVIEVMDALTAAGIKEINLSTDAN